MDWWDTVEESDEVERKANRLVNVLARFPGSKEQKLRWLVENLGLMESELERDGISPSQPQRFAGGMKSLAIRWWRHQWKQVRFVPESSSVYVDENALTDTEKLEIRAEIDAARRKIRRVS